MVYRGTTILDFMRRPAVRWMALALVALLPLACASAPAENARFTEPAPQSEGPRGPVTVDSIDVRSTGQGSELRLTADGPLVWTQYRDDAGNLVVELPNSVTADSVASLMAASIPDLSSLSVLENPHVPFASTRTPTSRSGRQCSAKSGNRPSSSEGSGRGAAKTA